MKRGCRAFTLVEISVVVLIIGIVASLSVPQIRKAIVVARSEALINDLRVFSQAFQHYMQEKGDWPSDSPSPGTTPPGMDIYLRESNWSKRTPIGGQYLWQSQIRHAGQKIQASISVVSNGENEVSSDRIQLEDIDRRIDDGNLATGNFRLGFGNQPLFVVEL